MVKRPADRNKSGCAEQIRNCEAAFSGKDPKTSFRPVNKLAETCAAAERPRAAGTATSKEGCKRNFADECDRMAQAESKRVLKHEQFHLTGTCVLVNKANESLDKVRAMIRSTTGDSSIKDSAEKLAEDGIGKMLVDKAKALTAGPTSMYDSDTAHGCDPDQQAKWESDIQKGLPSVIIA
jgi:hypothetical protein